MNLYRMSVSKIDDVEDVDVYFEGSYKHNSTD